MTEVAEVSTEFLTFTDAAVAKVAEEPPLRAYVTAG